MSSCPACNTSAAGSCPHGACDTACLLIRGAGSSPASAAGAAAGDTAAGLAVSANSVETTLSAALPLSAAPALPLVVTSAVSAEIAVDDAATSAGYAAAATRSCRTTRRCGYMHTRSQ